MKNYKLINYNTTQKIHLAVDYNRLLYNVQFITSHHRLFESNIEQSGNNYTLTVIPYRQRVICLASGGILINKTAQGYSR